MVHTAHILRVIERIESNSPIGFQMGIHVCATDDTIADKNGRDVEFVACIAGHAAMVSAPTLSADYLAASDPLLIEKIAANFMGLTVDQMTRLFFDLPDEIDLDSVTPRMAISVLKGLAATGEVRWLTAFRAEEDPPDA